MLSNEAARELGDEVAGLPTELDPDGEDAKRFDVLLLRLQLARLGGEPGFERLRDQVMAMAGLLEEKAAIPMVREQLALIHDVQTDEWWQDVTLVMLERVRRRLRGLVQFIDSRSRQPVFTDFEDVMGPEQEISIAGIDGGGAGADFARFRSKAHAFLRAHQDHVAVHKLRTNRPLTDADLGDLERVLVENGIGARGDVERARQESHGLGLFVRSLVGLDREAAKEVFAGFLGSRTLGANQIEFVNLIIDHLTEHGTMEPGRLYESPFSDLAPHGPEGLFEGSAIDALVSALEHVRRNAEAA